MLFFKGMIYDMIIKIWIVSEKLSFNILWWKRIVKVKGRFT